MGTTSGPQFLSEDGLPYGMPSGASLALHPSTPFGNPPTLQTTVEAELLAQMTSLRKEMAKLQERNAKRSDHRIFPKSADPRSAEEMKAGGKGNACAFQAAGGPSTPGPTARTEESIHQLSSSDQRQEGCRTA
ncbi:unnamed protein product [Prunus armeniaca]